MMLKQFVTNKRVAIGAYISLGAFLLAHTVNAFVADALRPSPIQISRLDSIITSESHAEAPRALADAVVKSGLFPLPPGANDSLASGQPTEDPAPPLEVTKKVALVGTVFGPQGGTIAILEDLPTKKQTLYRIGEQIPTVGALSAIEKNRVLFRMGKQEEWLELALFQLPHPLLSGVPAMARSAPAPHPSAPRRRILDRSEIVAALADKNRLLTQEHATPYFTNGKLDGVRLYSVVPSGLFGKVGLQGDDLLQRINGVEIRDPIMLQSFFQQLQNERTVRIDIVRNSQRQTLNIEIR